MVYGGYLYKLTTTTSFEPDVVVCSVSVIPLQHSSRERRQRGAGKRAPLDFHTWYKYSR